MLLSKLTAPYEDYGRYRDTMRFLLATWISSELVLMPSSRISCICGM